MKKNTIIKSLRINHIVTLLVALAVVLSFECGLLQKGVLLNSVSATATYVIQVAVVMLTVILIPLAIKGFTSALDRAKGMSEDAFLVVFCKKSMQRTLLLFFVMVLSAFAYYALAYDGAMYCGLLGLGFMIYGFPTRMTLEHYLNGEENNA